jgi:CBS domain-containing protein
VLISEILALKGNEIVSVPPDCTVREALARMVEKDISSVVVMSGGTMVGLLTGRDILKALHERGCALTGVTVAEVMVTEPIIGNPDDTVDYVRGVMTENHITHLPVMEGERLLGIISFHDVARACLSEAKLENRLLKRYIRHWPE